MIRVFGIPNCDTVKKARAWLDGRGVSYEFVDFKKQPPSRELVSRWVGSLGRERVLNRKGTTWRNIDPDLQAQADTDAGAVKLLTANPSAIKRPVIEFADGLLIGFDPMQYEQSFSATKS
jgi:arsenate reductase